MKKVDVVLLVGVVIYCTVLFFTKVRDDTFLRTFNGKDVTLDGVVTEEPNDKGTSIQVIISVRQIVIGTSSNGVYPKNKKSEVSVSLQTALSLRYGDEIRVEGILAHPQVIVSADGSSFDYPAYLGVSSIFYVMKSSHVELVSHNKGSSIKSALLDFKQEFISRINALLPDPYALLASGLIVAGKGALSDELQNEFKRAGIIHVVVLSGSNVTIAAEAIMVLLSSLPIMISTAGGIMGIIAFAIIAGLSATVVRSVVMSIIAIVGTALDKSYDAFRALIIAACIMAMINPDVVVYDPSFQLSFAGTLGLMLLGKRIEKRCQWIPDTWGLREIISSTCATQICVTPIILHLSGMFSVVALVVNILVVPLVPLTMLLVFCVGCTGFISALVSPPFVVVSYCLLWYELTIVKFFSSWSFSAISIPPLSWSVIFGIYGVYGIIYLIIRKRNHPRL